MVSSPVSWNPVTPGDRARSLFNETSAALIATFGVPGFFTPRIPPAPLWPPGSPQSQSYYDTAPLKKTLERLVDFDRINDLKMRLSVGAVGVTSGNFRYFDNFEFRKARQEDRPGAHHGLRRAAARLSFRRDRRRALLGRRHRLEHAARSRAGRRIQSRPPDLPGRSVQCARGTADVAAGSRRARKGHPLFQPHPHEYRQEQADPQRAQGGARSARQIAGSFEERSVGRIPAQGGEGKHRHGRAPDLQEQELRDHHSKDYDFSHVAMVEHWNAGVRDVHQSMRHKDRAGAAAIRRRP